MPYTVPPSSPAAPPAPRFGLLKLTQRQAAYGVAAVITVDAASLAFLPRLINSAGDFGLVVIVGGLLAAIVANIDVVGALVRHARD